MKQKNLKKKAGSLLLAAAMIITSLPVFSRGVQAAEGATESGLSVTAFATREQLMTAFSTNVGGYSGTIGKLAFGKDSQNEVQNWYILGQDDGVDGENTVLVAADSIATGKFSEGDGNNNKMYTPVANTGYDGESVEVYANHYGASGLYEQLNEIAESTNYFAAAEQRLMNETTVTTHDNKNDVDYTTTARLYAPTSANMGSDWNIAIQAGSYNQIVLAIDAYWGILDDCFWLRAPNNTYKWEVAGAEPGSYVKTMSVNREGALVPAFNLNLSSVLFASAAKAASSENAEAGEIANGSAMTLRLDGIDKAIGTVVYDTEAGKIKAQKDADATGTVSLVVQGNDGTGDWYYSVQAGEATVVTKEQIQEACDISGDISLAECKIWMETTEDSMVYAKEAWTNSMPVGEKQFATKEQLRAFNTDDTDVDGKNSAKLCFGNNNQEWWIVGSQEANRLTLFAADPLEAEAVFDESYRYFDSSTKTKSYKEEWGCTYSGSTPTEVNASHYGGSLIRDTLKELETSYFSAAEQNLMKDTTVYTYDAKNDCVYSTADKLYLAYGDKVNTGYITVGTNADSGDLNNGLHIDNDYWGIAENRIWLRAPIVEPEYNEEDVFSSALVAVPEWNYIYGVLSNTGDALVPAFELDLSAVSFASAAKAASSGVAVSEKIVDDAAMALRLNGDDQNIGTVIYDTTSGGIEARKDANATGTVSLVVQGNNGTEDWYYSESVQAGESTVVTKSQIQTACGISGEINLADCKIWLETTEDKVAYAKMAEAGEVSGAGTLEPGKTVVCADATISNGSDGTVTIDKGSDGTVDLTVKLPQAGSIEVSADGKVTIPAGGKVQATGGKEITLSDGGTVDTDGTVGAGKITVGDTTVTAPEGGKVTSDKDGNITVPAGGTVQATGGEEITLPDGGAVDKDGTVEAERITIGDTTVTAPEGGKVTSDKDGNITVPAGGTVQTGDGEAVTLPNGGTVDQAGNITEPSFEGKGTVENPYQIKTEEDLKKLAELVNSGKDPKKAYYKIEAEEGITLTEESSPWTPIGTAEHPFTGTFDGNGNTIKGLEISGGELKDDQGLFGVNAGTIENLTVEGSVTGKDNVGGIAGTNTDTGIIKNCTLNVSVTGQNGVGGIAGQNNGTVTGCTNKGSVTGSGTGAGGIVGTNGENGKVKDNVNNGNVVGNNTGSNSSTIGAVIGKNDNTNVAGDITGNYYQKTDGINKDLTGIGGTEQDPAGITSGSSPTPGEATPSPAPGGNTPSPAPGGNTSNQTPGGSNPGSTPGSAMSGLTPEQQEKVNQIAKELNVPVETAKKLLEMAQELGIETDTLLLMDQDIVNQTSERDVKGSNFSKIQAKATKAKKNRITVKWNKVKGADGYQIYVAKCGKKNKYKLVKTIEKAGTTSFTYKKLKKGTGYRFIVRAYKNVDGKNYTVAASRTVHEVTLGGKRTNPKSVKVNKRTAKIRKGKKFKIKSKIVKASSGKKLSNHRKLSYESTNKQIATVSKKGVIRGKKAGKCYVYVYAENGIFKKVKVTVK